MIMEAEKLHDLPPASWRLRRVGDKCLVFGQKPKIPAWTVRQREEIRPSSTSLLLSGPQWIGRGTAGEDLCFALPTESSVHLIQEHPHRYTRIMFNQISGHPMAQSSWHKIIHHKSRMDKWKKMSKLQWQLRIWNWKLAQLSIDLSRLTQS